MHHTHRGAVRSAQVVEFLGHVLRHVAGEVVVVLDRAMIHRSKAVQAFVQQHERLSLVYLPPYAPELNPIELIWADLKRVGPQDSVELNHAASTNGSIR
nr:transposase [Deinococcus sp. RIT780]